MKHPCKSLFTAKIDYLGVTYDLNKQKNKRMKNTLFLSSALMVLIWIPAHFAFHLANAYFMLVIAAIIVLIRFVFNRQLDQY